MCKHGDTVLFPAEWFPASYGKINSRKQMIEIDRCISDIVLALNRGGVYTISSCCGHGKGPGDILLADGRKLILDEIVRPPMEVV